QTFVVLRSRSGIDMKPQARGFFRNHGHRYKSNPPRPRDLQKFAKRKPQKNRNPQFPFQRPAKSAQAGYGYKDHFLKLADVRRNDTVGRLRRSHFDVLVTVAGSLAIRIGSSAGFMISNRV